MNLRRRRARGEERRWWPHNRLVSNLTDRYCGPPYLIIAVYSVVGMPFLWPLWLGLAVLLPLTVLAMPYGWRLDERGLYELRFLRRPRLIPIESIRHLESDATEIRIETDQGTLCLSHELRGIRSLVAQLRVLRGEREVVGGTEVSPEQVAEWLGIEVDGHRVCGLTRASRAARYLLSALALVLLFGPMRGTSNFLPFALLVPVMFWLGWRNDRCTLVTAHGLLLGDGRFVPWEAVNGVPEHGVVATDYGTVLLVGPSVSRVAGAIQRIINAREAGAVLPRMTEIPDHAISRAESAEVSAERGISAAEGDGG
jgi:hypothetical protein